MWKIDMQFVIIAAFSTATLRANNLSQSQPRRADSVQKPDPD